MHNKHLAEKLGLTEDQTLRIGRLHSLQYDVNVLLADTIENGDMWLAKELLTPIEQMEYLLQDAWGFPRDKNYHKFWYIFGCLCPILDNEERYPTGVYIINGECPLHGVNK